MNANEITKLANETIENKANEFDTYEVDQFDNIPVLSDFNATNDSLKQEVMEEVWEAAFDGDEDNMNMSFETFNAIINEAWNAFDFTGFGTEFIYNNF